MFAPALNGTLVRRMYQENVASKKPQNRFYLREVFLGRRWPTFQPRSPLCVSLIRDVLSPQFESPESTLGIAKNVFFLGILVNTVNTVNPVYKAKCSFPRNLTIKAGRRHVQALLRESDE